MLARDLPDVPVLKAEPITDAQLHYAHPQRYVDRLEAASPVSGLVTMDPDTHMGPHSLAAARLSAGAACMAVDQVMTKKADAAFSAARPPGHHAIHERTMGFCFFANAYIAARYAQEAYGVKRVAIVDFDVHHGNGTAAMIYQQKRDDILFASSHQHPFWPGTGGPGDDDAGGLIINMPLPAMTNTSGFQKAWMPTFARLKDFAPELLVISAGFDAHRDDPVGGLDLTESDFTWITQELRKICPRIVSILEGGYSLEALESCVLAHLEALRGTVRAR